MAIWAVKEAGPGLERIIAGLVMRASGLRACRRGGTFSLLRSTRLVIGKIATVIGVVISTWTLMSSAADAQTISLGNCYSREVIVRKSQEPNIEAQTSIRAHLRDGISWEDVPTQEATLPAYKGYTLRKVRSLYVKYLDAAFTKRISDVLVGKGMTASEAEKATLDAKSGTFLTLKVNGVNIYKTVKLRNSETDWNTFLVSKDYSVRADVSEYCSVKEADFLSDPILKW